MIKGIGIDIVSIERFQKIFDKKRDIFLKRIFTKNEICFAFEKYRNQDRLVQFFAGRFAAKEAVAKASGFGFGKNLKWLDLEILPDQNGIPILVCEKINRCFLCFISISHEKLYAIANVVLEEKTNQYT